MKDLDKLTDNCSYQVSSWNDYRLIDSGGYEKLEQFGQWILRRPEPQAVWNKSMSDTQWLDLATASFLKESGKSERGQWKLKGNMPEQWWVECPCGGRSFRMRLGLTSFKHVGLFPEQAFNWDFIYDTISRSQENSFRVLNLFAYTGGATLAASLAGAEVTHVDSVKQVVNWASRNAGENGIGSARWIVDDAMKFVRKEARRGNVYDGIILDPPAYGRGPDGEKWVLEEQLNELIMLCKGILRNKGSFLILNLYSMGLSPMVARTLVEQVFFDQGSEPAMAWSGEVYFKDDFGKGLPLGCFYRFRR